MERRMRHARIAVASVTVLLLAGCGDSDDARPGGAATTGAAASAAPTSAAATSAAASSPATASPTAPAAGTRIAVAANATLGDIVVDAEGFTLYRFDKDSADPPRSSCAADCLATWPPAVATGEPEVAGVDAALVGTITRDDGTRQVTLAGWPLYRFAPDARPGDATGQGVGGVWWAVTPTGEKVSATPTTAGRYAPVS